MSHTEYKNKSDIRKILFSEKNLYDNSYDGEVIYYNNYFVKGKSYSYLNAINSIEGQKTIRPLINREFENLENIYPGMGACFLDIVMKNLTNLEMVSINEKITHNFSNKLCESRCFISNKF